MPCFCFAARRAARYIRAASHQIRLRSSRTQATEKGSHWQTQQRRVFSCEHCWLSCVCKELWLCGGPDRQPLDEICFGKCGSGRKVIWLTQGCDWRWLCENVFFFLFYVASDSLNCQTNWRHFVVRRETSLRASEPIHNMYASWWNWMDSWRVWFINYYLFARNEHTHRWPSIKW